MDGLVLKMSMEHGMWSITIRDRIAKRLQNILCSER
jgi:hypothetical protein